MTKKYVQTYVEILYPGVMVSETEVKKVLSRDPSKVKVPNEAYGFRFYDRTEITTADGELLAGKPKNYSGAFYFGKEMTTDDVKREVPNHSILLSNMKSIGWKKVVKTRLGNFQQLTLEDTVLAEQ